MEPSSVCSSEKLKDRDGPAQPILDTFSVAFLHSYKMRQLRLADPEFKRTRRNQQLARAFKSVIPESFRDSVLKRVASQHAGRY